ncbi:receptor-like cytosolic serine/threonine-protein kinase RBK1 [Tripterygium wilfordii]|uniref:receptor-like cytosolic serine/threonine-protein kinase RBK1 n=1 Tax=Tripterygium wilfordii TaxID=458696 RepID=UPI0018F7F36F|nr:receptor-like cytosolic serine/threonine-protein kinase RBK1 [Tripterygium wilfordii]
MKIQKEELDKMAVKVEEEGEAQEIPQMEKEMEVTLDDASPRGVLEIPVLGSDSDHSSRSSGSCSSFSTDKLIPQTTVTAREGHGLQWRNMIDTLKKKSMRRFSVIPLLTNYEIIRKTSKRKLGRVQSHDEETGIDFEGIPLTKPSWRNFSCAELVAATDNFSADNLVGEGGHAKVYKGCLSDGQLVAVKKLIENEKEEVNGISDFLSELGIIAHIDHPNVAKFLGFSIDDGLHLVLEFYPHGSLASVLHGGAECLEWKIRFKVAIGVAEGLQYLHHDCPRRIIHRDIKASNILLTQDYEAEVSDFGLAKWLPENWVHHVVFPIEGTFGYLAPEYFMHGIVDEKTDIFAFGVLLLELITGRRAVDSSRQSLVIWAKPLLEENSVKELVDPRLGDSYDPTEMKRAMLTASECIHHLPSMRPPMNRVLQLLKGEDAPTEFKQKRNAGREILLDACDMQDYTCTTYLNDLNRHMQLAME